MTEQLHDEHPHDASAHPPAEEDQIRSRAIVGVGVAALLLFFVASLAAIGAMKRQQARINPEGPAPLPAELGKSKIGIIEQRLFESSNQAEVVREVQRAKLESYGWVDRTRGIIRIPVEQGMQLVIAGKRPEGAPTTALPMVQPGAPDVSAPTPSGGGSNVSGPPSPRNGARR